MEFHMINITYTALHMRAQMEKMTFSCKDDCTLYIDEARMVLDIFRFAVFFLMKSKGLGIFLTNSTLDPRLFYLKTKIFDEKNPPHFFRFSYIDCS